MSTVWTNLSDTLDAAAAPADVSATRDTRESGTKTAVFCAARGRFYGGEVPV
jgi:hypothetical protein